MFYVQKTPILIDLPAINDGESGKTFDYAPSITITDKSDKATVTKKIKEGGSLVDANDAGLDETVSYSIVSNLVGMHIIRTAKTPFVQSNANKAVYISSILLSIAGILLPYTFLGNAIGLVPVTLNYLDVILPVTFLYCIVASFAKKIYIKKYGEWI